MDAGLSLCHASLERFRRVLRPGLADGVAAMLATDLEQAEKRVRWLRARIGTEATEGAA